MTSLSTLTAVVALAAVTMTFGALIAVFFVRSSSPQFWGHLAIPKILWVNTAALLVSSLTLESARKALARNQQMNAHKLFAWTTGLACFFLIGQAVAWLQVLHSGVSLQNNAHSWFIFLFSGLHGLHIVVGIAGIAYLLARTREHAGGPKYQMTTRAVTRGVSLFWHYLDLLWLLLFALLLIWKR